MTTNLASPRRRPRNASPDALFMECWACARDGWWDRHYGVVHHGKERCHVQVRVWRQEVAA